VGLKARDRLNIQGLRLGIAQIQPALGDLDRNVAIHQEYIRRAREAERDLLVFPELSLTGYFLRDMVPEVAQRIDSPIVRELAAEAGPMAMVFGMVEEDRHHRFYNAAVYCEGGEVRFVHRKVYLPTYGMFDEMRYFARGNRITGTETRFGRIGIVVCEDIWHMSTGVILQAEDVRFVVCIANSPSRGTDRPTPESQSVWQLLVRSWATFLGVGVVFANRCGYEDGICFWGGSEVVGPDTTPVAQAPLMEETLLEAQFDPEAIRRERIFSPLARDERLLLTIEELERIKRERFRSFE